MNTALLDVMPQRPPGKWPFPPPASGARPAGRGRPAGAGDAMRPAAPVQPCPGAGAAPLTFWGKAGDLLMVLAWGALIPGLMWLGHAAGF